MPSNTANDAPPFPGRSRVWLRRPAWRTRRSSNADCWQVILRPGLYRLPQYSSGALVMTPEDEDWR
jgi:hypothetical protein